MVAFLSIEQTAGSVRNTTRIASVLQSKATKKQNRYKRLFALDDAEDDDAGLVDRPHVGTLR